MRHSFNVLKRHDLFFIAPNALSLKFYQDNFPEAKYLFFDSNYFSSANAYSKLLISADFYQSFINYTHALILQPDSVVLRDELDYWMASPFDYIGAPWAKAWEFVCPNLGSYFDGKKFFVTVGNGGLSLRRISAVLSVLEELKWLIHKYHELVEDAFFSLAGHISSNFMTPNEIRAAQFSIECEPRHYYAITGRTPMGTHAWEKWDKPFWVDIFEAEGLSGLE